MRRKRPCPIENLMNCDPHLCDTRMTAANILTRPPLSQIIRRAAHWRCPNCGRGRLFRGVFRMLPRCQECGLSYFPEQGYYVGAMIINYAATTACVVTIFLLSLLFPDFTRFSTNLKFYFGWLSRSPCPYRWCGTLIASGW